MHNCHLFCPVCLCAVDPGRTPAGEYVMSCRNEHCHKTVAAAVAADALLTVAQVAERRRQHADLFAQAAEPPPADSPGGDCPDHGPYEGDECPKESLFPPSYLARMFWRDRSIFLAELATLTPEQLAKQAVLHVRYLDMHAQSTLEPRHLLLVWQRMLAAIVESPDRPPFLARVA